MIKQFMCKQVISFEMMLEDFQPETLIDRTKRNVLSEVARSVPKEFEQFVTVEDDPEAHAKIVRLNVVVMTPEEAYRLRQAEARLHCLLFEQKSRAEMLRQLLSKRDEEIHLCDHAGYEDCQCGVQQTSEIFAILKELVE